jgi:hypothetical protein
MELTQEMVKKMFDYRADGELIRRHSIMGNGNYAGAVVGTKPTGARNFRYSTTKIHGEHWCVHKLIYLYHHGVVPDQLDHINRDSTDNRIENLRPANSSENTRNRRLFSNNTSGCKGVTWNKRIKKWQSYVSMNSKTKHLGYFEDLELADLVSTEARDLYHGKYATHA